MSLNINYKNIFIKFLWIWPVISIFLWAGFGISWWHFDESVSHGEKLLEFLF